MACTLLRIDRLHHVNHLVPSAAELCHPCHEVVLVLRGAYRIAVADAPEVPVPPGWGILLPAGTEHRPQIGQDGATELLCCGWEDPALRQLVGPVPDRGGLVQAILERLLALEGARGGDRRSYRRQLLTCLRHEFAELASGAQLPTGIAGVRAHLDAWYMQPLSIANLCSMFELGRSDLFARFKAAYEVTPVAYIRGKRAAQARHLLTSTTLSLGDIAQRVGVGGIDQLTRLCHQVYAQSATALRRHMA